MSGMAGHGYDSRPARPALFGRMLLLDLGLAFATASPNPLSVAWSYRALMALRRMKCDRDFPMISVLFALAIVLEHVF